jgi:hypothetical protein
LNPDVIKEMPKLKFHIQMDSSIKVLKQKLVRIINLANPEFQLTEDHVRLWKCHMNYHKPSAFAEFLRLNHLGGPETKYLENNPALPEIDENTGVEFPGLQLEYLQDKTMREIDRTSNNIHFSYDLVVAEITTPGNPFIFRYNRNPGTYGKCENCYTTGILTVQCVCKKASYCTADCKRKDEKYHLANCEAENVIDFEKMKFEAMPFARKGVVGLCNLGNTCFMNSAL